MRRFFRQLFPILGFVAALHEIYTHQVSSLDITLFVVMFVITMFGFEAGFHRHFSHGAFTATPATREFLGVTGSMFGAGSVLWWSTMHRVHHAFSDVPGDPHSPLLCGSGWLQRIRGWWHAYSGFLASPLEFDTDKYSSDLLKDKTVMRLSSAAFVWYCIGIVLPGLIAYAVTLSWRELASGIIWGGLARIFWGRIASLTVQCFCHVWGTRPYRIRGGQDRARNNWLFVPGTLGMGWHNNHHAFPYTYSNCFSWWQFDPSAWGIRFLKVLGLVDNLKFPSAAALADRRDHSRHSLWYD
jgi:stearoyl-CoA desaturase (delta-9 desaturase)